MSTLSILVLYATTLTRPVAVRAFRQAAKIIQRDTGFEFQPRFKPVRPGRIEGTNGSGNDMYERQLPLMKSKAGPKEYVIVLGKRGPGGTAGVGDLCGYRAVAGLPVFGQALLKKYPEFEATAVRGSWIVVAHELGHNLGADHDTEQLSIMNAGFIGGHFSQESKDQIALCMAQK